MHHRINPFPITKDGEALFVHESDLLNPHSYIEIAQEYTPSDEPDNIQVFVPLDINKKAILDKLESIIYRYGEASEENEFSFSAEVDCLWKQAEIYDQIWYLRHMPKSGKHSEEGTALATAFVAMLEEIPDACAECFPFEMIDEIREEYGF